MSSPSLCNACTSDACKGGRIKCPTPDACEVPTEELPRHQRMALALLDKLDAIPTGRVWRWALGLTAAIYAYAFWQILR